VYLAGIFFGFFELVNIFVYKVNVLSFLVVETITSVNVDWRFSMKLLRVFLVALALAMSASAAQARDSFHIGINIGGFAPYGYPAVGYHVAPPVVYHAPRIYHPAPVVVYPGVVYGAPRHFHHGQRYFNDRHHGQRYFNQGHGHHRGHR